MVTPTHTPNFYYDAGGMISISLSLHIYKGVLKIGKNPFIQSQDNERKSSEGLMLFKGLNSVMKR